MRQSLLNSFSEIYVLNLHGNSKKKETTPEGNRDDNVFDIQQGVSIAFFIKQRDHCGPARVFHSDLWGLRREKYDVLNASNFEDMDWQELVPQSPSYFFVPFDYEGWREYEQGWKVTDIFPVNSVGIVTSRDKFVMDFDLEELRKRILDFRNPDLSDEEIRYRYNLRDTRDWKLNNSRAIVMKDKHWERHFSVCHYRPYDSRHIYFHPDVVEFARLEVMKEMLYPEAGSSRVKPGQAGRSGSASRTCHRPPTVSEHTLDTLRSRELPYRVQLHLQQDQRNQLPLPALPLPTGNNLGLITTRITKDQWGASCSNSITGHKSHAAFDVNYLFPLYLYDQAPISASRSGAPAR